MSARSRWRIAGSLDSSYTTSKPQEYCSRTRAPICGSTQVAHTDHYERYNEFALRGSCLLPSCTNNKMPGDVQKRLHWIVLAPRQNLKNAQEIQSPPCSRALFGFMCLVTAIASDLSHEQDETTSDRTMHPQSLPRYWFMATEGDSRGAASYLIQLMLRAESKIQARLSRSRTSARSFR